LTINERVENAASHHTERRTSASRQPLPPYSILKYQQYQSQRRK
jgi:hypothetical protein